MNEPPAPPTVEPAEDEALWRVPDLAQHLQLSKAHVYRLVQDKKIPYIRVSDGSVRFVRSDIREWVSGRRVPAVPR